MVLQHRPLTHIGDLISTHFGLLESDQLVLQKDKTLGFPVSYCLASVVFLRLFTWLKVSSWSKTNVSWNGTLFYDFLGIGWYRLLQQKTMIAIETNIVADNVKLWLRGNFYDSFGSIGNGRHLFCFFFYEKRATEVRPFESEVKWNA